MMLSWRLFLFDALLEHEHVALFGERYFGNTQPCNQVRLPPNYSLINDKFDHKHTVAPSNCYAAILASKQVGRSLRPL